jgi:ABC-2 type transport system permease protein
MRAYWAIVSARFRMSLQYRSAALAGIVTQLFWGLISVMVFTAFYHSTTRPQPMALHEVIDYIWLGQALLLVLPMFYDNAEIAEMVRTGTLAYELLRPVDLYGFWYTRVIGTRVASVLLRAIPQFLLAGLFLGLEPPHSASAAAAWLAATVLAVVLSCAMVMVSWVSTLWHLAGDGVMQLLPVLIFICSGAIVPLPFFPDWAQGILNWLPFRGLWDLPFRLYTGHIPAAQAPRLLLQQTLWIVALVLFGRWLLRRGTRRLVVQGG